MALRGPPLGLCCAFLIGTAGGFLRALGGGGGGARLGDVDFGVVSRELEEDDTDDEDSDEKGRSMGEGTPWPVAGEVGESTRISGASSVVGSSTMGDEISKMCMGVVSALVDNAEKEAAMASRLNEPARILCFDDRSAVAAATRGRLIELSPLAWRILDNESLRTCSPECRCGRRGV